VITTSATAQVPQAQLARLEKAMHLSPQQMDAWRAYQSATAPNAQGQAREASAQRMLPQLPTPRRIALMQAVLEDRLADFRRRSTGVETFYQQLTPDQQRTFDRETSPAASRNPGD
jgi:protein CpxP